MRLRHIRDHAREAVAFLESRARGDLNTHRMLQLAMVRLLSIISEAARRVTPEGQAAYPSIPWLELVAFRTETVDNSFRIDNDVVWQIVQEKLPALIAILDRVATDDAS